MIRFTISLGQRAQESLVDPERNAPDGDRRGEIVVGQFRQRAEENLPPAFPLFGDLGQRHIARREFRITVAPRLLAVRGEQVGELGLQVAGQVPDDDRDRVAVITAGVQLLGPHLSQGALAEELVADEFGLDEGEEGAVHWSVGLSDGKTILI